MFQLGFADTIQADREREIAELVRVRRLLDTDVYSKDSDEATERPAVPQPER